MAAQEKRVYEIAAQFGYVYYLTIKSNYKCRNVLVNHVFFLVKLNNKTMNTWFHLICTWSRML